MPLFVAVPLACALCLLCVALWQLLFVVWPEVRSLIRLQCLALRSGLTEAGVEIEAQPYEQVHATKPRRSPVASLRSHLESGVLAEERAIEEFLHVHGLPPGSPLPPGYVYRGGEVVYVRGNGPLEADASPLLSLQLR